MTVEEAEHLAYLLAAARERVEMSRRLLASTKGLIRKRVRARLQEAVPKLSPQDRQYVKIRDWIDRSST